MTELVLEIGAPPNIEAAVALVEAAIKCGGTPKGQLYTADTLTMRDAPTYGKGIKEPKTQYEAFSKAMPWDDWIPVIQLAKDLGRPMFFSVFTEAAVDWCEKHGIGRYKIASADITHRPLIEYVARLDKPMVISTGGATWDEVDDAWRWSIRNVWRTSVTFLACGLSYPCPPEAANLRRMETLRYWPNPRVGYSDHTEGIGAMYRAVRLGADMIEKHFTVTPGAGGDHDFAATPLNIDDYQYSIKRGTGDGWPKYDGSPGLEPSEAEMEARMYARRSIVVTQDMYDSQPLTRDNVDFLRPGTGIPPSRWFELEGQPVHEIRAGTQLNENHLIL
jgi:pseudaminic acid synthase